MPAEEPITVPIPVENANISGIIKLGQERRGLNIDLQFFAEKDIKKQSTILLQRSIRKFRTRIEEHENKINNPKQFYPDWDSFDERYKAGLQRHWKKEIRNFQESIQNRIDELRKRGEWDE